MPLFVTFVNVQGSQTQATYNQAYNVFKTYHKLQGSQTSNLKLVITEPILLVIAVIYVHFHFIIKHLSQSII